MQVTLRKLSIICCFIIIFSCTRSIGDESFGVIDDLNDNSIALSLDSLSLRNSLSNSSLVTLPNGLVLEKIDSVYYLDDMCFSESSLDILMQGDRSACRDLAEYYWPYGEVYYKFNINVPPWERNVFISALDSIKAHTAITFKYRYNNGPSDYIEFYKSSSVNDSYIGRIGGPQTINIVSLNNSTIVHEVMHSLGFFHEHCRADRDDSITVVFSNIKPEKQHNFKPYTEDYSGMDIGPFDFQSIMLYGSRITDTSFVYDTSIPVMTKKSDGSEFYQGAVLSSGDINGVKSIYGPPFHRLEHNRLSVVEDDVIQYWENYITEDADSLVFYADKACTIRQALQYPRRVRIKRTERTNNGYNILENDSFFTLTIPAGTVSYCIWHGFNYECYYSSNPNIIDITSHEVINALVLDEYFDYSNN